MKSLIEGFNVPAVDIGIIVASSGSVRQRIQSMGRVMRRHRGKDGQESTSSIHILYARDTTEDSIYGEVDWERLTGAESNIYHHWSPGEEPVTQEGPPREPRPGEDDIDIDSLETGDDYPGAYTGKEYSCDNALNVKEQAGEFVMDPGKVAEQVIAVKGQAGKFRVTPNRNLVLVRIQERNDWVTRFVMQLDDALVPQSHEGIPTPDTDPNKWEGSAEPGQPYPWPDPGLSDESWKFKATQGGKISRKITDGESFARGAEAADDARRGQRADLLVDTINSLKAQGEQITRLMVTDTGHVLYRAGGELRYIGDAGDGLEFPEPPA